MVICGSGEKTRRRPLLGWRSSVRETMFYIALDGQTVGPATPAWILDAARAP